MKKLFLALALWFCALPAFGANIVFSDCGVGNTGGCTVGNDATGVGSIANPYRTITKFKTEFGLAPLGTHLQFCQGGAWDSVATGNMSNANSTATTPIVVESVDCTAFWVGGAGVKPRLNINVASGAFSFRKGSVVHTEGLTIKDISIVGDGVTANIWGIVVGPDTDYVTIDNVTITGATQPAIQFDSNSLGNLTPTATTNGITEHCIVRNSTLTASKMGILSGCWYSLIEKTTFTNLGLAGGDHGIYMGDTTLVFTPQTVSGITGNGATATLTTAAPHAIPTTAGYRVKLTVTGAADAGYNVAGVVGTVTGASTITYPATGTGSSVGAAYTNVVAVPNKQVTIRSNTLTEGSTGAAGTCANAHIISHGDWSNMLIEGNLISESVVPTSTSCSGIEIDDGGYAAPNNYEKFNNVVIRGNTVLNTAFGISLDLCVQCLIENNYVYTTFATGVQGGIRMRSKNFVPGTIGTSTLPATDQSPNNNTVRYNTVYLTAPNGASWGIAFNGNIGDPLTGTLHNFYGNVVVFGSTATVNTECFDLSNLTVGMFSVIDYNACYYAGASVPKWRTTSAIAAVQLSCPSTPTSDCNSLFAATADVTTGQPFLLSPATTPTISTSSALKHAGHPTLGPTTGWGGSVRNQGIRDIGAFEFGATLGVVPGAPTPQ